MEGFVDRNGVRSGGFRPGAAAALRVGNRNGVSLAEVLVALTLLALGLSLSGRLLVQAGRDLQGAELGLRAAILLTEMEGGSSGTANERISVGGGWLMGEQGDQALSVRFEPGGGGLPLPDGRVAGSGGFLEARVWRLDFFP